MSLKRKHAQAEDTEDALENVFRSEPIEDRDSKFIGYFSPTLKPKDLQNLAEFQSASHKILAWRRESNQQSINKTKQYVSGSDEDGEKFAGKKVEKTLEYQNVEGACVVARWYGGVLLGPVRFAHIETCAKGAVKAWKLHVEETRLKKRKVEEDEAVRKRLCKSLEERDQSIVVLRELAADKERTAQDLKSRLSMAEEKNSTPKATQPSNPAASMAMDYANMPLDRLKGLDKARDATIAFLLKRIDKAEAEMASTEKALEDPP